MNLSVKRTFRMILHRGLRWAYELLRLPKFYEVVSVSLRMPKSKKISASDDVRGCLSFS